MTADIIYMRNYEVRAASEKGRREVRVGRTVKPGCPTLALPVAVFLANTVVFRAFLIAFNSRREK